MLRIAIQSKGRMMQESISLLSRVGVELTIREENPSLIRSSNFPAEVVFIEKERIPECVANGVADVGIVGECLAKMYHTPQECIIRKLGFDRCTISLAIPRDVKYKGIEWFIGKSIATPYPELVAKFLRSRNVKATLRTMREGVYKAPKLGMAEAICDRVHSGTMLFSENLKEVETVMVSEAVMIVTSELTPSKSMIFDEFVQRIDAVQNAVGKKLVMMHVEKRYLNLVLDILPALKSPMVTPIADEEWVGVSTVMDETRLWDIVEKLKLYGVENMVILPVEKVIY